MRTADGRETRNYERISAGPGLARLVGLVGLLV